MKFNFYKYYYNLISVLYYIIYILSDIAHIFRYLMILMKINHDIFSKIRSIVTKLEQKYPPSTMSLLYVFISTIVGYINLLNAKHMVSLYSPFQISYIVAIVSMMLTQWVSLDDNSINFIVRKSKDFRFLTLRNCFSIIGQMVVFFYVTQYIPISLINTIYGLTPIIVFILDRVVYSTQLKSTEIIGSFMSFIGILLVLDIFQWSNEEKPINSNETYGVDRLKYSLICLLGCSSFAAANIVMKELSHIGLLIIQFNWSVVAVILMTITMVSSGQEMKIIASIDLLRIIVFNGFFGFIFLLTFTRALQLGKKGRVAVVNNLGLIYAFIVEIVFYNESPSFIRLLGSIILVLGVMRAVL